MGNQAHHRASRSRLHWTREQLPARQGAVPVPKIWVSASFQNSAVKEAGGKCQDSLTTGRLDAAGARQLIDLPAEGCWRQHAADPPSGVLSIGTAATAARQNCEVAAAVRGTGSAVGFDPCFPQYNGGGIVCRDYSGDFKRRGAHCSCTCDSGTPGSGRY